LQPAFEIPTLVSCKLDQNSHGKARHQAIQLSDLGVFIGDDALNNQAMYGLQYPMRNGVVGWTEEVPSASCMKHVLGWVEGYLAGTAALPARGQVSFIACSHLYVRLGGGDPKGQSQGAHSHAPNHAAGEEVVAVAH
jgi:hypothetical protein